jgi:hypothetical protein
LADTAGLTAPNTTTSRNRGSFFCEDKMQQQTKAIAQIAPEAHP